MQTISFNNLKKKFQAIAGLASMDATDMFFFKNSLNTRLNSAWSRANYPELIEIVEVEIASDTNAQFAGDLNGRDVLEVYNKNPYKDRTSRKINYNLIDSKIYLNVDELVYDNKVYVLTKKIFTEYDESSDNLPKFLESYLISAILSDFYRGDGQSDLAQIEDSRAEDFLLTQIDKVERQQQQNSLTILQYNNIAPNTIMYS